jgi:hypothetical protein
VFFVTSNGVPVVHAGLVKLMRPLPENVLPPLFVMALTTPPLKRPNSAEMPESAPASRQSHLR